MKLCYQQNILQVEQIETWLLMTRPPPKDKMNNIAVNISLSDTIEIVSYL
jgi:hypothetical protein